MFIYSYVNCAFSSIYTFSPNHLKVLKQLLRNLRIDHFLSCSRPFGCIDRLLWTMAAKSMLNTAVQRPLSNDLPELFYNDPNYVPVPTAFITLNVIRDAHRESSTCSWQVPRTLLLHALRKSPRAAVLYNKAWET